jgi:soluble P-type ATPase
VDFVSEEAEIAGMSAADYIKNLSAEKVDVNISTDGKIRYTVPQKITEKKDVAVYFRVADVFRNVKICVYNGEDLVLSKKKAKVAPGEMERVMLESGVFENCSELTFRLEEM